MSIFWHEQAKKYTNDQLGNLLNRSKRIDYVTNEGSVFLDFNNIAQWVNSVPANGTAVQNERETFTGNKTLKLSVTTEGSYVQVDRSVSMKFAEPPKLLIPVYLSGDTADYSGIEVQLKTSSSSYFAAFNYFLKRAPQGWFFAYFTSWKSYGSAPNWGNITQIRVRLHADSGKTCSAIFDAIRIGMAFEPKIIFRFDDGLDGVYQNAFPYMEANGLKGTVYLNPGKIEGSAPGFATLLQCKEMYEAGWDCGNHSYNHLEFINLNYADTLQEIKTAQDWLIEKEFFRSARHFCVPHGYDTGYVQQALRDVGALTSTNSVHASLLPYMANLFKIPAQAVYDTTTVSTIVGWIDSAITTGRTLVLMFHNVKDIPASQYEYSTANFQAVVDYIVSNSLGKYVVTMSEWYEGLNR